MRVDLVDEVDLPLPVPVLELLLSSNRALHVAKHLKVNQHVDVVSGRMSRHGIVAMLPKARFKIGRNTYVERAVRLARKQIDAGVAFLPHGPEFAAKWVLKQVQDDEKGLVLEASLGRELVSATTTFQFEMRAFAHVRLEKATMEVLTVNFSPELQAWIDHRVAQGRYVDAAEYLRDLIRRDLDGLLDWTVLDRTEKSSG